MSVEAPTECPTCGALVADEKKHRQWHRKAIAKDVALAQQRRDRAK